VLDPTDAIVIRAAVGWLELGLPEQALAELEEVRPAVREHPDLLEIRWLIYSKQADWTCAAETSARLIQVAPERASSWLHHAYAIRRMPGGSLAAAFEILSSVADRFPAEVVLSYNMACYTCQLGRAGAESIAWIERAIKAGQPREVIEMALADSDLAPLRSEILALSARLGIK